MARNMSILSNTSVVPTSFIAGFTALGTLLSLGTGAGAVIIANLTNPLALHWQILLGDVFALFLNIASAAFGPAVKVYNF